MKAKIKNCLNQNSGVFVKLLTPYEVKPDKAKIDRIIYVMRRHHYYKDFDMPTCSLRAMIKHDKEYASLMEYFVRKYWKDLVQAGYNTHRGDGVGFCYTSYNQPFLMFSVGGLIETK
jgi:hypothetical protein